MSTPNEPPPVQPAAPKKRGCFFYGCLTTISIVVLLVIGVGGISYYSLSKFTSLAVAYTDTSPMQLPKVEVEPAVYAALQKRVKEFKAAMDAGKSSLLMLTAEELNALVAGDAKSQWKGRVWFTIKGGSVGCQLSMPLDSASAVPGMSKLKGRYLNGSAVVRATMETGTLFVSLQSLEVKGKPLPAEILNAIRRENLAKNAANDRDVAAFIDRLASVGVQDDKLILVGKVAR
ncbi:MAG: hypothetical protein NT105_17850 [Verrucomicrobia bacterium]|nr:hypothetical protein [Verrucomicrobiota bacterium]